MESTAKQSIWATQVARATVFVGAVAGLLVFILHWPFDGYLTDCLLLSPCANLETERSFFDWVSLGALIAQLATITQLLVWECFVLVVTVAAVLTFSKPVRRPTD